MPTRKKSRKTILKAVKQRMIYAKESGVKIRSREESHYLNPSHSPHQDEDAGDRRQQKRTPSRATSQYPEQTVAIGSTLTEKGRKELCSLLKQNLDIFAWKPADMTGVPRSIAEHRLNIREGYSPVRQKKRGQAPERNKAIQEEVEKLVDAGIMKEVHYHSWLSNPVMVKKHDGTWRMCVDFKDLNNACPKDCYPLPEIDWKVESLCGYSFKCFLDAYKGYHQIKMAKEDEEKTAFITSQGIFCYSKMSFGLKNAGSTYQRLVDKAFQRQIGRNLEVYVDDLVIKSRTEEEIIRDITETFKTLRQINMKLNSQEVHFRNAGRNVLRLQKAKWKLASLNRFLSKSAEKSLPFFKTLKNCTKKSDFQWTPEAEEAFKQMKRLIAELPTLTAPREREELIIYLAAAKEAISAVLMTDREGRQIPVYFVSRTLRGPEVNYTPMEKLVLALLSASKRLKRYFQAHTVVVITNQPIKQLLSSSEISGRMLKWKFELEGYDIQYRPRTAIKGQILADFIVEHGRKEESPDDLDGHQRCLPGRVDSVNRRLVLVDGSGAGNPSGVIHRRPGGYDGESGQLAFAQIVGRQGDQTGILLPTMLMDARKIDKGNAMYCQVTARPRNPLVWKLCFPPMLPASALKNRKQFGLVERANRSLGEGIKARLEERSKDWIEELPHVLWAHRTMIKSSNGETPFSLTYGTEAVIPAEIGMPTLRTTEVDQANNTKALGINLDLIEERREL
ncbi:reverse transcriptase domain-containing protein [Tanacetum coccineum]